MAKEIMRRISPATAVARLKQMKARLKRLRNNTHANQNGRTYDMNALEKDLSFMAGWIRDIEIYHRYPERHEGLLIWAKIVLKMMVESHAYDLSLGAPNALKKGES